jgi:hypothetical protein
MMSCGVILYFELFFGVSTVRIEIADGSELSLLRLVGPMAETQQFGSLAAEKSYYKKEGRVALFGSK